MKCHRTFALIAIMLVAASTVSAQTQCVGDDGFNVGCCNPVTNVNIPQFPPVQMTAVYGCIKDCNLEAQFNVNMQLSAPIMVACDYAIANLNVSSGPGGPTFAGLVILKYSRTWLEHPPTPTGQTRQVWRYLINTDVTFAATAAAAAPCPVPLAALPPLGQPIHMVGSVEYMAPCQPTTPGTNPFSVSLSLTHVGCLNHEFFSQRPLTGPAAAVDRVYALVAPANFAFNIQPEPAGQIIAEAVRPSPITPAAPYQCFGEARVGQGVLATQYRDCFTCGTPTPGLAGAWAHQSFNATAFCASGAAAPMAGVPVPPWFPTGMMALSLGNWVGINPAAWPGNRSLHVYYGIVQYTDPCTNGFPFHLVTGIGNTNTDAASLFGNPLGIAVNEFLDLQNMLVFDPPSGAFVPGIGEAFLSSLVWNLNTL